MSGEAPLFGGDRFLLVAGPCVLEDHGLHMEVARELVRIRDALGLPIVFKACLLYTSPSPRD